MEEKSYSYFPFYREVILPKVKKTHCVCSKQKTAEQ